MPKRLPNPRRVKIHRNYTVEEIADRFGVHKHTIRNWLKQGLPVCDSKRPLLVLGRDLADFLTRKRQQNKRPCKPGEIYCMRCRVPRAPALGMIDYHPVAATNGNLVGMCPECGCLMYRRVNLGGIDAATGGLAVKMVRKS